MNAAAAIQFALPPVVGAGIGLFTNWLAIKMLFRPLAERRILGIRLPFTPGILPRERSRMAKSMGDTVATDLLDDSTITARLKSPAFKDAIRQAALKAGRKLLDTRPVELASGMDRRIADVVKAAGIEALSGLAASEAFSGAVNSGAGAALASASDLPLSDFVPAAAVEKLAAAVASPRGAGYLGGAIADAVMAALRQAAADGKSVSSFIEPESVRAFTSGALESAYPALIEGVNGMLADKTIKASMEKLGARIIRRTLDRFNSVQRFFIGLGQYDKAILDNMPATVADFTESVGSMLSEGSTRTAIIARVSSAAADFTARPLSGFAFIADPDAGTAARDALAAALSGALASMDTASAARYLSGLLEKSTAGAALGAFPGLGDRLGRSVAGWAAGLFGGEHGHGSASDKVAQAFFAAFSLAFKERASGIPLGQTVSIDDEALEALAASASEGLADLAASESSGMLRSMDIRSLVIEKIDSLDMIDVERMILRVVDKELGAITVFGGILGAIIGVFQSLLFLLR